MTIVKYFDLNRKNYVVKGDGETKRAFWFQYKNSLAELAKSVYL